MGIRVGAIREPQWYDLRDGVKVLLRPFDAALEMQAVAEARPGELAPIDDENVSEEERGYAADVSFTLRYTLSLAKRFVIDWVGVEDQDGQKAAVTTENLTEVIFMVPGQARFLRSAFDEHFLAIEKKGSSHGRNGAGQAATPTAEHAPKAASRAPKNGPAPTASFAPSSPIDLPPK